MTDSSLHSTLIGPAALGNAIATPGWLPSNSSLSSSPPPPKPKPVIHRLSVETPLCRGVCTRTCVRTQVRSYLWVGVRGGSWQGTSPPPADPRDSGTSCAPELPSLPAQTQRNDGCVPCLGEGDGPRPPGRREGSPLVRGPTLTPSLVHSRCQTHSIHLLGGLGSAHLAWPVPSLEEVGPCCVLG